MESPNLTQTIPSELSNSLPIFQLLGDKPLDQLQQKKPEGKKTLAKIIAGLIFIGVAYMLLTMILPPLLALVGRLILLGVYAFAATLLYVLFGPTVRLVNRLVKIGEYKANKAVTEKFAIETLRISMQNIKDTLATVTKRIASVEAIRLGMLGDAQTQTEESAAKFDKVKRLTEDSARFEAEALKKANAGDEEGAGDLKRKAMETRIKAGARKSEGEAAQKLSAQYAQYANGLGKAVQGLKNNETSLRIQSELTESSVNIIESKLRATDKMRQATEGLAGVLQIQDSEMFNVALAAVNFKINDNLANVHQNLEFLNENRLNTFDVKSQEELEAFVSKLDSGVIKKLDVAKISSPYHQLTSEEKVDKTFNLDFD